MVVALCCEEGRLQGVSMTVEDWSVVCDVWTGCGRKHGRPGGPLVVVRWKLEKPCPVLR